ncbi:MAG: dTDP-glucose 4,6-dehydratase [Candidatus Krumholzibacteriia bacterium]|jgi:dTDP-glucose 4,6-dehydratase
MNILVTGGAGFIGSNYVRLLLESSDDSVVNFDLLTYAGNLENLAGLEDHARYKFVRGDVCSRDDVKKVMRENDIDAVVHFAAESHVDRSVEGPEIFVLTNVVGTEILLEESRSAGVDRFVMVSTDEVYGSLGKEGLFTETTPLSPNSPYAASKASADLLCRAFFKTFDFPVMTTRCSNNYGPYQFPEKLIPLMIANALEDKPLPVYGDGKNIRDWLYVADHCTAIDAVLRRGRPGGIYNIGGCNELTNIALVEMLVDRLGKSRDLITFVKDRPGHDQRYAIDSSLMQEELGWQPSVDFAKGLDETVTWYLENREWWEKIRSGDYQKYYEKMYGSRGGVEGGAN